MREISVCPRAPKQYCSALQNFSWRSCYKMLTNHYVLYGAQLVRHLATSLLESSNDKSMSAWYASHIEAT
jgi:hypothetical protein